MSLSGKSFKLFGDSAEGMLAQGAKGATKVEARAGAKVAASVSADAVSEVNETLASKYRNAKAEGTLDEVIVDVDSLSEAEATKVLDKVAAASGETIPAGGSAKNRLRAMFSGVRDRFASAGDSATARWNALSSRQRMGLAAGVAAVAAVGSVGASYYLDSLSADASVASDSAAAQGKQTHLSAAERLIQQISADKEVINAIYEDLIVDESLLDDGGRDSVSNSSLSDYDRIEGLVKVVADDLRQLRARAGIDATGFELLRRLLLVDPDYLVRAIALNKAK